MQRRVQISRRGSHPNARPALDCLVTCLIAVLSCSIQAQTSTPVIRGLRLLAGTNSGTGPLVILDWSGGTPPFQVQSSSNWAAPWLDVSGVTSAFSQTNIAIQSAAYYRVLSVAADMAAATDKTAPTVPANLTVTATSRTEVNLAWSASTDTGSSGLKGYNIYRNGIFLKQVPASMNSTVDLGLEPSTIYAYTVSAVDNAWNQSPRSSQASATTLGPGGCAFILSSTNLSCPAAGLSTNLAVISSSGCSWTAASSADWVKINSGNSSAGSGTVNYVVAANTNASPRTGILTVAGTAFTISQAGASQNTTPGQLGWVKAMLSSITGETTETLGLACDTSGNVIVVGDFNGTANFGAGPVVSTSVGDFTAFVAKYNPQGSLSWVQTFGGRLANGGGAKAVVVDSQNNIVVVGYFAATADFGGIRLSALDPYGLGSQDMFVAKYSPAGALLWVKQFGGALPDYASGVAVDGTDNIFLTGWMTSSSVDFGGVTLHNAGNANFVLAKLDSLGNTLWAKACGGAFAEAFGIAVDPAGDVVVTGEFSGDTDIGGGTMTATSQFTAFLAKYSGLDGSCRWAKGFGGSGYNAGFGVSTDPNTGNVVVTGAFTGNADFGGGAISAAAQAVFLAGYDPTGKYLWVQTYGGATGNTDCGKAIHIDAKGNLMLTGFKGTAWNLGSGWVFNNGLFVLSSSLSGNNPPVLRWSKFQGSASTGAATGNGITSDAFGNVFVTGSLYSGTVDLGGISATTPLGSYSGFVSQYSSN